VANALNLEVASHDGESEETMSGNGPKWEQDARKRLNDSLRRFKSPITDLLKRDANEGDTRLLVTDFICDALGYDKYADLTTEYRVRGQYADFGIRIDRTLVAFIEVKRMATPLNKHHLNQVQNYALNEGVQWIFLTNGARWQAYHVTPALPVETDLALDIDLTELTRKDRENLFFLTKESFSRGQIDELWQATRATSALSLGRVLLSERVLNAIRLELRSQTSHRIETEEIEQLLRDKLIRADVLEGLKQAE
jgi:predicted type IV restriction endonuclease